MIRPSLKKAKELGFNNNLIPISKEIFSDIKTPIQVLRKLKEKSDRCYLLESVEGGEMWGRYSFLGYNPQMAIRCLDRKIETDDFSTGKVNVESVNDPLEYLRNLLKEYKSCVPDYLPAFTGGLVGYFSYDFIKYIEEGLELENLNEEKFDDFELMLFDKVIVFDHLRQKMIIIVNIKSDRIEDNYKNCIRQIDQIEELIKEESTQEKHVSSIVGEFESLFTEDEYCRKVESVKKHIYEGDIFQAVISNRMKAAYEGDLLSAYRVLRTINPSPYMFYISAGDLQLAGASPETMVRLDGDMLYTFPIAGTCPRSKNPEHERKMIDELINDEKELAEHTMLVDLGRNDLGKISRFGTVKVENYRQILKFSHVVHIASTVTGRIKEGFDRLDAIRAVLPAGTLSGAPKRRACEIINRLEGHKRGVYGGAVGYIDFSGNLDFCIAIRMAVKKAGNVYVQAGAGIVADSKPEKEYRECKNKAKAMINALKFSKEAKK